MRWVGSGPPSDLASWFVASLVTFLLRGEPDLGGLVSISITRGDQETLRVAVRTAEPDGTRSDTFRDVHPGETFFRIPYHVLLAHVGETVEWEALRQEALQDAAVVGGR